MNYDFTINNGVTMMACPKGSAYWALSEMMKGRAISGIRGFIFYRHGDDNIIEGGNSDDNLKKYTKDEFVVDCREFGPFRIYKDSPDFKKGDWIRHEVNNRYYQVIRVNDEYDNVRLRVADSDNILWISHREVKTLCVKASIKPDFQGAEVGDTVFSVINDYEEVQDTDTDEHGDLIIMVGDEEWYTKEGFMVGCNQIHPTLFDDHHQAQAYISEVFMRRDKELKA